MSMIRILLFCVLFQTVVNAKSACEQVSFVDRAGWGARDPTSITNLTTKPFSFYVIHHTYQPPNCYDDTSCIERVKLIQDMHQINNTWADVGYHFLVGENGKVYEGRGWDRQGAHAPGWNNDAYGICIIGDFQVASPNQKALDAVKLWIDCGVEQGHVKKDYYIITHRQSQRPGYTVCPGNGTVDAIKTWPRYCSYQNSGMNLTQNETQLSIGSDFCRKQLGSSASANMNYFFSYSISIFFLFFLHVQCFIQ
ncbi:unnamed protein product [Adineta steineri]|uniref:Uncharacterized protein n=1 Tax=Adineta steineri TaxID=433720 RepID=A0A814TBF1_9BILA|nr:unnamed protein product [Adineta steineri]CAF1159196.1 unnamed protein product [Adineta steineri]CAF3568765.1 unnamed protein product [Adineta steineri]CAF3776161.1 unnamed protein product [Adineta steineri]